MSGKINANLSTPSIQALRAERQEGVNKSSFWDKWSNLSTGQKWGRALAWVIPPLGISLQAGANLWQARQAKAAAARPMESTPKQSDENVNGISLRSQTAFGSAHRKQLNDLLAEHPDIHTPTLSIGSNGDSFKGLANTFEKDVKRDAEVHLKSSKGHGATINKDSSEAGTVLRDFFKSEFQGSEEKAEAWALLTSKYANQTANMALNNLNTQVSGFRCTKGAADSQMRYALYMENDGNSALLEANISGDIDNISDPQGNFVAKGNDNIDWEKSRMEETLLLRLKLGPPESCEVISAHTKHLLVPKQPSQNSEVENAAPVQQAPVNQSISNAEATRLLRNLAQGMFAEGSDRFTKISDYKRHLLNQESLDLAAFKDAFTQLDEPGDKQKLVGELAGVIKDKEQGQYMELAREGDEVAPAQRRQMLSDIRLNEDYPLSTRNAINPEKGPVVENARDLDIQNFVHRKFEEEIAQKHLGIPPEEFYQIIKEGMGAEGILTTGYLNKKNLPPFLDDLRTNLRQDFQGATTLDDFYQRAENTIATARQNAPELGQNREIQEAQPTVVRGAVTALVLNSTSTSPAEMKSLAADLKKSQAPDLSFQINVLKDHTPVIENWVARTLDSATDPEALRNEREFYTKDTGRTVRTFFIGKDNGEFEKITFPVGVNKQRAANLEQNLETALQSHTSFKKTDDFLNVTQGFLHQGAFAAIFSKTSGATGLTMSDFTRSTEQPSFTATLHRDGKIHIEGRMDTTLEAIDQGPSYLELDAKQSSLSQSFQLTLLPTTVDGQTKVDCEVREAEVKGTLQRPILNGAKQ
jgi:hypothetical protein